MIPGGIRCLLAATCKARAQAMPEAACRKRKCQILHRQCQLAAKLPCKQRCQVVSADPQSQCIVATDKLWHSVAPTCSALHPQTPATCTKKRKQTAATGPHHKCYVTSRYRQWSCCVLQWYTPDVHHDKAQAMHMPNITLLLVLGFLPGTAL